MTREQDGESAFINESLRSTITTGLARCGEIAVLTVSGDIDSSTTTKLEAAIDAVLAERPTAFIIDMSAVEFLGSAGLKLLIAANEKAEIPSRFAVVANKPATTRPIELTDLDKVFLIRPTLDEAITSLQGDTLA